MKALNRRSFIKGSLLTAASLSIPVRSWSEVRGANETIRFAVVGLNGRGADHIHSIQSLEKEGDAVTVVALCDVDQAGFDRGLNEFKKRNEQVETYQDIRKLLENKEVDA